MKKKIIISAINFFEAGPLSILKDCLMYLDDNLTDTYEIIAYVHKKELFNSSKITYIELPKSRKSYIFRLYYEYIWFYFQSKKIKPYLWLSLHDITPNVKADIRAVYCHNPSPFYRLPWSEFLIEPSLGVFKIFYKYLYKININKNNFVLVQQNWIRNAFIKSLKVRSQILLSIPQVKVLDTNKSINYEGSKIVFFYPAFARVFKNIECACGAAKILNERGYDFELRLTISGDENRYSKLIYSRYHKCDYIKFNGKMTRNQVFDTMSKCTALVFPSKLETWGLPITEAKCFNKPIFASNLPYALETVGNYSKVSFFNPDDCNELALLMESMINKSIVYHGNCISNYDEPYATNWAMVFGVLLQNE